MIDFLVDRDKSDDAHRSDGESSESESSRTHSLSTQSDPFRNQSKVDAAFRMSSAEFQKGATSFRSSLDQEVCGNAPTRPIWSAEGAMRSRVSVVG